MLQNPILLWHPLTVQYLTIPSSSQNLQNLTSQNSRPLSHRGARSSFQLASQQCLSLLQGVKNHFMLQKINRSHPKRYSMKVNRLWTPHLRQHEKDHISPNECNLLSLWSCESNTELKSTLVLIRTIFTKLQLPEFVYNIIGTSSTHTPQPHMPKQSVENIKAAVVTVAFLSCSKQRFPIFLPFITTIMTIGSLRHLQQNTQLTQLKEYKHIQNT